MNSIPFVVSGNIRIEWRIASRTTATLGLGLPEGQIEEYTHQKGQLQQSIEKRRGDIEQLKAKRKQLPRHILMKELPLKDRFEQLRGEKKHFVDTIKLIAYRAETAMAQVLREKLKRSDEARTLLR